MSPPTTKRERLLPRLLASLGPESSRWFHQAETRQLLEDLDAAVETQAQAVQDFVRKGDLNMAQMEQAAADAYLHVIDRIMAAGGGKKVEEDLTPYTDPAMPPTRENAQ